MIRHLPLFVLVLSVVFSPQDIWTAEVRVFTSAAGTTLRGELVEVQGDTIKIKREDGQLVTVKAEALSAADVTYLQAHGLKSVSGAASTAASKPAASAKEAADNDARRILRIVEDVLFPDWNSTGLSLGWTALPQLQLDSDDPELSAFAQASFADFCKESGLPPAISNRVIEVHIGEESKIKKLIGKEKYKPSYRNGSAQSMSWDAKNTLERSVVFISRDKFANGLAKADVHLWMAASFGLWGYSQELKEEDQSTFSHDFARVQTMSPFDRKLLSFIYKNIPPGTKKAEVRSIFRKAWQP